MYICHYNIDTSNVISQVHCKKNLNMSYTCVNYMTAKNNNVKITRGRSGDKKVYTGMTLIAMGIIAVLLMLGLHIVPLTSSGVMIIVTILNSTAVTGAMILQSGLIQGDQHVRIVHSPEYKLVKLEAVLTEEESNIKQVNETENKY